MALGLRKGRDRGDDERRRDRDDDPPDRADEGARRADAREAAREREDRDDRDRDRRDRDDDPGEREHDDGAYDHGDPGPSDDDRDPEDQEQDDRERRAAGRDERHRDRDDEKHPDRDRDRDRDRGRDRDDEPRRGLGLRREPPRDDESRRRDGNGKDSGPPPSWMKRGADAQRMLDAERARAEAERASRGGMWPFRLKNDPEGKPGTGATVVFLDGDLVEGGEYAGRIDVITYREHEIKMGAKDFRQIPCNKERGEECPLCEAGERYAVIAPFTIIDMRAYTDRDGKRHENKKRLFKAKPRTLAQLQKIAAKRGGLRYAVFEISRVGDDRTPSVGNQFDFEKHATLDELRDEFRAELKDDRDYLKPAIYEKEIQYLTPAQVKELVGSRVRSRDRDRDDESAVGRRRASRDREPETDDDNIGSDF